MKDNKINHIFDRILYGTFLILPLLMAIIYAIRADGASFDTLLGLGNLPSIMGQFSGYMSGTFIYGVIDDCIGVEGLSPLVNSNTTWLLDWLAYAVTISVLHLLLDVLMFFPEFLRNLMHKCGLTDEVM